MAMFGSRVPVKPFQIDGIGGPVDTRGAEMGALPGVSPAIPQQDGGFLGKAAPWMGVIGDALLAANNRPAMYTPMIAQQRMQEREQQNAIDRWKAQYDYERAHPKLAGLTEQQRNYAAYQAMTPEERKQWAAYQDLYNPRYTNTPSGTQMVPRVVDTGAPPEAVQALHADPSLAAQFDQKYGPGASSRYLNGGGAGNGSGGFHIPSGNPLDPRR